MILEGKDKRNWQKHLLDRIPWFPLVHTAPMVALGFVLKEPMIENIDDPLVVFFFGCTILWVAFLAFSMSIIQMEVEADFLTKSQTLSGFAFSLLLLGVVALYLFFSLWMLGPFLVWHLIAVVCVWLILSVIMGVASRFLRKSISKPYLMYP